MSHGSPYGPVDRTSDSSSLLDASESGHWVAVWTAMPQLTENDNMPPPQFNQPNLTFNNSTLRQTLRISTGGCYIRIKISNAFGLDDLEVTATTIALPSGESGQTLAGSKSILSDTIQHLTFDGSHVVEIPTGAFAVSDPVKFPVQPGQVMTVNMFLRHGQTGGQITSHPGSRTQTWIALGDDTKARDMNDSSTRSAFHWYFISGVEAWQPHHNCAFALLGDSITDGRCSTDNGNNRWPDLLFNSMLDHPFARNIAILNQAAGGNRILRDGLGPNVLSRLDRDVFGQPGVKYIMILEGVNDIGTAMTDLPSQIEVGDRLIWAYKQIISRAHAFGIPVFCSTICPFSAPEPTIQPYSVPSREQTRQKVNSWIRESSTFDAVIDFDAVLRDPNNPAHLNSEYNSGDYLHPNVKAFQAMADAFPMDVFEKFVNGVKLFN